MSIALLIADDRPVMRESLHVAFSGTDIEIVGEATTSGEALNGANDPRVDVLLLDVHWQLDGELTSTADGMELLRTIRAARRDLAILMYSADGRADSVARCRRLGANGYLAKASTIDCWVPRCASWTAVARSGRPSQAIGIPRIMRSSVPTWTSSNER